MKKKYMIMQLIVQLEYINKTISMYCLSES